MVVPSLVPISGRARQGMASSARSSCAPSGDNERPCGEPGGCVSGSAFHLAIVAIKSNVACHQPWVSSHGVW
jgi:hypothetical protein